MPKVGDIVRITIAGPVERLGNSGVDGGDGHVFVKGAWYRPDEYEIVENYTI
jgi:hypothetical protein